ncbi:MAG TPA: hypothetical protein VGS12_03355 [Caulobacteraceae bacterium]|nr:hypothetical protein [Caulobacteraceae bacterium]
MSDPRSETTRQARARRGRNLAIAVALFAFVAVVFVVTLLKLSGHVLAFAPAQ